MKINARRKGHNYERKIAKELRQSFFSECATSRYENRLLDDQKVDLTNTDPFQIQCKAVEKGINYHEILSSMPNNDKINCIFHKRERSETVTMSKKDFYDLLDHNL